MRERDRLVKAIRFVQRLKSFRDLRYFLDIMGIIGFCDFVFFLVVVIC